MDDLPEVLSLEAIAERLVTAAGVVGLEVFEQRIMLDTTSLERTLLLALVPGEWTEKDDRRAELAVGYSALQTALAQDTGRGFDEEETELSIDVEFSLVGQELALSELEAKVKPLVEKINLALGGEPRPVYYTVATDYAGSNRAVEAKVLDGQVTSILDSQLDLAFMEGVARALRAIGPG